MSYTVTANVSLTHSDGALSQTVSHTTEAKTVMTETIAVSTTNREIVLPIDISEAKAISMRATGTALTIKTNDSSTPDDTIALAAGVPKVFVDGTSLAQFLTADVDSIFVTNASASTAAVLEIVVFKNVA